MSTDMYPQGAVDLMVGDGLPYEPDEFERAADEILSQPKPRRAGDVLAPPVPTPSRPKATGLKKVIRRILRDQDDELALDIHPDDVNRVTNVLHRAVRERLAEAWAAGYDAGDEYVGGCCGCTGSGDPPTNPYES